MVAKTEMSLLMWAKMTGHRDWEQECIAFSKWVHLWACKMVASKVAKRAASMVEKRVDQRVASRVAKRAGWKVASMAVQSEQQDNRQKSLPTNICPQDTKY